MDFSKAFDRVDHQILCSKLNSWGFSNNLVKLLMSYFSFRRQTVSYNGFCSKDYYSFLGVLQGSLLGPLLFDIFIDDIFDVVKNCQVLLFADDMKIFRSINCSWDCELVQSDLNGIIMWCVANGLCLNESKCNVMSFTRGLRTFGYNYQIGSFTLSRPDFINDLGITFDNKLNFNEHVSNVVRDASKMSGFLWRNCSSFNVLTLKIFFSVFVRTKLEYASIVWHPIYICQSIQLEKMQRNFLKLLYY